jgi:AcrR family transcriptional regulator
MDQESRRQRSRKQVLDAALRLFSHRGYRATSVRDIARAAGVSTGNLYHHFAGKEAIFLELLNQYWAAIDDPRFAFNEGLARGFPDDLEVVGRGARTSIRRWRRHVALIYVDVVEFDGKHIRKFYMDMARRFESFLEARKDQLDLEHKLRPGVPPVSAVMLAGRVFLNYFSIEILFGVPNHFGQSTDQVVAEVADMLRYGILRADVPVRKSGPAASAD